MGQFCSEISQKFWEERGSPHPAGLATVFRIFSEKAVASLYIKELQNETGCRLVFSVVLDPMKRPVLIVPLFLCVCNVYRGYSYNHSYVDYDDRTSHHSLSRGSTPALDATGGYVYKLAQSCVTCGTRTEGYAKQNVAVLSLSTQRPLCP